MGQGMKLFITILSFGVGIFSSIPSSYAIDKQGKTGLETYRSRPKENQPSKTKIQRVQESTKEKVSRILRK